MKKIIAINLGSTSTKVAYYENDTCVFNESIQHPVEDIKDFATVWDQFDYRKKTILKFMEEKGLRMEDMDAVAARGGHTEPLVGGTYFITSKMLEQSGSEKYGNHVADLGLKLAASFSGMGPVAYTVDPPVTDEFEPLARYSGIPEIKRRSSFHVLNQRAAGRQYAADNNLDYESINLIVVHMGGGISVAAHKKGKLVDANNALDGDGPFSTNRCCSVPVGDLVKMCYSGKYTHQEMKKILNGKSGLVAYTGDTDVKNVSDRAEAGDKAADEALEAMCYQIAKEIGANAAVLAGDVQAIVFTGGIAHSKRIIESISKRVSFIAPVSVYPGEYEMQSLALNTYNALIGKIKALEL